MDYCTHQYESLLDRVKKNSITSIVGDDYNLTKGQISNLIINFVNSTSVGKLCLSMCNVDLDIANDISNLLIDNRYITKLTLQSNCFGFKSADSIVDILRSNNTLISLDIGFNNIGPVAAIKIAESVSINTTIKN